MLLSKVVELWQLSQLYNFAKLRKLPKVEVDIFLMLGTPSQLAHFYLEPSHKTSCQKKIGPPGSNPTYFSFSLSQKNDELTKFCIFTIYHVLPRNVTFVTADGPMPRYSSSGHSRKLRALQRLLGIYCVKKRP